MKKIFLLLFLIGFLLTSILRLNTALAETDKCADPNAVKDMNPSELSGCIDNLTKAKNQSIAATTGVQKQVTGIKARISQIQNTIPVKEQQIADSEERLLKLMESLNDSIKKYYIKTQSVCIFCELLLSKSISEFTKIQTYQQISIDQDKALITNTATLVRDLQTQKKNLEAEKIALADVKTKLDKVVSEAQAYQNTLSSQIASLSARQQQILAQRLSSLGIPLFASSGGSCSSDLTNGKSAGFGGGFGFFTYGVPNRVGLNQYGAFGRAKAGKSYEDILRTYYNFDSIETRDAQITVQGHGTYSLEEYVKRIYEVPDSWGNEGGMEALKAQAIAARSYALAYTNNGAGSICTTEQCQVFQPNPKGGNWEKAVNETSGKVIIQGGAPIKAWFSSTHGGYIHSSDDIGWNSTSWTKNAIDTSGPVSSFSDLNNNAYDKDSPWFYCDWGARSQYGGTAWLKPEEVADIVNVVKLASIDSSVNEHLYQTDKGNPAGTDTWDAGRVRQELTNRGVTPFTSVSGISVDVDWGSGKVSTVHISGNAPDPAFSGSFFKTYFNLRAPATIQIVGPLYNIERN